VTVERGGSRSDVVTSERLGAIDVTGVSGDGTVRVRLAGRGAPEVEFDDHVMARHTEQDLGEQITAAVVGAVDARRAAVLALLDGARGGRTRPDPTGTPGDKRRERFDAATGGVAASAASPCGHVTVDWYGAWDIEVRIRPGTLGVMGITPSHLAADVGSALAATMAAHSKQVIDIHQRTFVS
jgi:DNA-binding protein YbaB